jgi:hypothetical protein
MIGILLSRVRVEEKWLLQALERRGVAYERIDDGQAVFSLTQPQPWQNIPQCLNAAFPTRAACMQCKC